MKKSILLMFLCSIVLLIPVSAYTTYTSNTTYTVPAGVRILYVQVWSAGGGGGAVSGNNGYAGGGGGGSYTESYIEVATGENYTLVVGDGGFSASNGGFSSFYNNTFTLNITGGSAGQSCAGACQGSGGNPGNITLNGSTSYTGGTGGSGENPTGAGGGGGGAGTLGSGSSGTAGAATGGGAGGTQFGGNGGNGPAASGPGGNASTIGGGGAGALCTGCGGARVGGNGSRGEIRITEYEDTFTRVTFNIRNINGSVVAVATNITLQSQTTLITYNFNTTTGTYVSDTIEPGIYNVQISASGFPITYAALTVVGNTTQTATYYVDPLGASRTFSVVDTLGNVVTGAVVSFSRSVNGSVVVVAQGIVDFTSFVIVNLNPNAVYSVTVVPPTNQWDNFTGVIIPTQDITYTITLDINTAQSYNATLNGIFYRPNATYNNVSKTINVTWEVISSIGELEWFALNTTYNGTNYSQNISGVPGGGIASVLVTGVNLSVQNSINVTFYIDRIGYDTVVFNYPFTFTDTNPQNSSITGGLFGGNNAPVTGWARAILGMIIVILVSAGIFRITNDGKVTFACALAVIGILSAPSVGLFSLLYGLITVCVGTMLLISSQLGGR